MDQRADDRPGVVEGEPVGVGSVFAPCACGRKAVLLYRRAHGLVGASNGPDADRLTLHDDLSGVACPSDGELAGPERS